MQANSLKNLTNNIDILVSVYDYNNIILVAYILTIILQAIPIPTVIDYGYEYIMYR